MDKDRYILFLGDSYCACISPEHYAQSERGPWQWSKDIPCYPSLVADHYGFKLLCHGYGGKSWWYSRSQFEYQLQQQPDLLNKIDAMVFVHTDWDRLLSDTHDISTFHLYFKSGFQKPLEKEKHNALKLYYKYLHDKNFYDWAGQNWFQELSTRFRHIKQVHFHCFDSTTKYNHLLYGQKFTTPLMWISAGEINGTDDQIYEQFSRDTRANHMNNKNNQVLAQLIINALDNYQDQSQEIPMSNFDLINFNYKNFGKKRYDI